MDAAPAPLAFSASVFLHLIVLSLVPYAGFLAPEIVIRPPRSEMVVLEYRVGQSTVIVAPRRPGRASDGRVTQQSETPTKGPDESRSDSTDEPPTAGRAQAAEIPDILVARFDAVIQLSPPDPPPASAIGDLLAPPDFVLDWSTPRSAPDVAVLAELTALDEASLLAGLKALPEFSAGGRFELGPKSSASLPNPALADFGPPPVVPPATLSGVPPPFGSSGSPGGAIPLAVRPTDSSFVLLRLDGHLSGRRLAYLAWIPLSPPTAGNPTVAREARSEGIGHTSGGQTEQLGVDRQIPVRPLDRRRYGIILVGPGTQGQIPEADGWFSGNPIYTVYLSVPGSTRKWVLQYCRPGGESRPIDVSSGVIRLRPRRALDPPFARRMDRIRLHPGTGDRWERVVIFAVMDSAGRLSKLRIIAGPEGERGERILTSLRGWEFLPAFEDGKAVAVETVFSIPLD